MINIENNPVYMDDDGRRDFVLRVKDAGHFEHLPDRLRSVLELRYLGERRTSYKKIGDLLNPPRSIESARRIDLQALSKLHRLNQVLRHPDRIESLELSEKVYNALIRSRITTLRELAFMSDEKLLGIRNFGEKSLQELREKLASHQMNQPTTPEVTA